MVRYLVCFILASGWAVVGCGVKAQPTLQAPALATGAVDAVADALTKAADALPLPPPPPPAATPPPEPILSPAGLALVVGFEIVSPAYYARRLERPIWPAGASGVTLGVGYDLGHQLASTITMDWTQHPQAPRLPSAAGVTGQSAKRVAAAMQDVVTPLSLAQTVFAQSTAPRYWQMTRRAYPGVDALRHSARDALFSLTYNRGSSMAGDRAREKREIRDRCIPQSDYNCISEQLLAMTRLWQGTAIEAGMQRRRKAEADLVMATKDSSHDR